MYDIDMSRKHKTYQIHCAKCQEYLLTYHKYGAGKGILRLYLSNIVQPDALAGLSNAETKIPNLTCPSCEEVIGIPIISKGQRWAFRMRQGYFHRKLEK